jgi:hypothetical protein
VLGHRIADMSLFGGVDDDDDLPIRVHRKRYVQRGLHARRNPMLRFDAADVRHDGHLAESDRVRAALAGLSGGKLLVPRDDLRQWQWQYVREPADRRPQLRRVRS